ncbi:hypothetical protein AVEN_63724-1 [Araneus ventricosus]|uniref:Uncharacterized protein n=1 Tax=Araneus ventricosus TaxID=182803 RepID=A0A4Y2KQU0_ARAVE|nr:hypothetical protein AVEN_63724-1 [Araneus ventricosus]
MYFGLYRLERKVSKVTYEVEPCDETRRKCKLKNRGHVSRMKPGHDPDLQLKEPLQRKKLHASDQESTMLSNPGKQDSTGNAELLRSYYQLPKSSITAGHYCFERGSSLTSLK